MSSSDDPQSSVDRRDFLRVAGTGGVIGASSMLAGCAGGGQGTEAPDTTTTGGGGGEETTQATETTEEMSGPQMGGTLTVALQSDPWTMHPHMFQDTSSSQLAQNFGAKLIDTNNQGRLVPDLAKEVPKPQDGGTKYVFKLREGVQFHSFKGTDYGEVTAENVVRNYRRIMDKDYGSPARADYTGFLVGENIDPEETIQATGKYEVTFNLETAYAPFLFKLTDSRMSIVPMDAVEEYGVQSGDQVKGGVFGAPDVGTVSCGPFVFEEAQADDHYTFVKNENYFKTDENGNQLPYVDKIVFQIIPEASTRKTNIQTGGIDISEQVPAQDVGDLKSADGVKINSRPGSSLESLYINQRTFEPFTKEPTREALGYGANKQAIKEVKFKGLAARAWSIFPPWHWAYSDAVHKYEFNPEKAKSKLEEAGETGLKFNCSPTNQPLFVDVAQILQQNYSDMGITMEITPKEKSAAWGPTIGKWDPKAAEPKDKVGPAPSYQSHIEDITYGFGADGYSYITFHTNAWLNVSYYSNENVDKWLEQARSASSREKRKELYKKAQVQIMDDIPQVPLVWWNVNQAYRASVHNFKTYPSFEVDLESVWISQS